MDKKILLSFDVEEFDIPEEYGQNIDDNTKFFVSLLGLKKIIALLDKLQIKATFFTTYNFAKQNKKIIRDISKKHEISSHGFSHSNFTKNDFRKSKIELEKIVEKKIKGFRMPRLRKFSNKDLFRAGYEYDSSINPTYLPGRYNNFKSKRTYFTSNNLMIFPMSVSPVFRFPLFWISFKNVPLVIYKLISSWTLSKDKYLNLYFHPWEFADIENFKIPNYIKKPCGNTMLKRLESYLLWLKLKGEFITFSEFTSIIKSNFLERKR